VVSRQNADTVDTLQLRDVAMATTFWLRMGYNFGCMTTIATQRLILCVVFWGQAIRWGHSRDRVSKGRCHGNQFWNYIDCKWHRTGDNDMEDFV